MEIEAKFRLVNPDVADVRIFVDVIEATGFNVDCQESPVRIIDTYFDTSRHALRVKGAAMRLRQKGGKTLLTYKRKVEQRGALHSRIELESEPNIEHLSEVESELLELGIVSVTEGVWNSWEGKAEEMLAVWGLIPMVEIFSIRHSCQVSDTHLSVASFVMDEVTFQREDRRGGYVGIEVEAIGETNTEDVMKIAGALKARLGEHIQEQSISKYEFALRATR